MKKIIAIDFDGTLHDGTYPIIGQPLSGAIEGMQGLHKDGYYLIIWSCRNGELLIDAINWLLEHHIPFHRVNEQNPSNAAQYGDNTRKVYADIYVDDRQVGGLPCWAEIVEFINNKKK